jgi:hypothetical protein
VQETIQFEENCENLSEIRAVNRERTVHASSLGCLSMMVIPWKRFCWIYTERVASIGFSRGKQKRGLEDKPSFSLVHAPGRIESKIEGRE